MPKILFVGGGSLGHIAPSAAVWEAVQMSIPESSAHFVCAPSTLDTTFLQNEHLPYNTLHAPRFGLSLLWQFPHALQEATKILEATQPHVIFSTGGNVSVPLCFAAKKRGIPIVLLESDAVAGRANTLIARWTTIVCTGFAACNVQHATCVHTGMPIRAAMTKGSKEEALRRTGLDNTKPILLVIGGSQGAQALNNAVIAQIDALLAHCQIIHITGEGKKNAGTKPGYFSAPLVSDALPHFYAAADCALSRAGANLTAELAANTIPTILVPLRGVGHDHQQRNAEALSVEENVIVLQQLELNDKLIPTLQLMLQKTRKPGIQNQELPNAATAIAEILREVLASIEAPQ